jgi:HSP20 family protein
MHDFHRILLSSEVRDLTDEVGRLFDDLERCAGATRRTPAGYSTPALDVQETVEALEVIVDLPGVGPENVRVLLKNSVLVVAGEKPSPYPAERGDATFHLVERGFGRFARAVRLDGAFDGGRARAILQGGELLVVIPKLDDRRGKEILVPITTA